MKKLFTFIILFLFIGLSFSSGSPLPKIKEGNYEIQYRKGKTIFVDFTYEVSIQGENLPYEGRLVVYLYNKEGKEIESFGQDIKIKAKELQKFYGTRMMLIKIVNELDKVVFDLGIYQKKY